MAVPLPARLPAQLPARQFRVSAVSHWDIMLSSYITHPAYPIRAASGHAAVWRNLYGACICDIGVRMPVTAGRVAAVNSKKQVDRALKAR